jgi:hypothetical protein
LPHKRLKNEGTGLFWRCLRGRKSAPHKPRSDPFWGSGLSQRANQAKWWHLSVPNPSHMYVAPLPQTVSPAQTARDPLLEADIPTFPAMSRRTNRAGPASGSRRSYFPGHKSPHNLRTAKISPNSGCIPAGDPADIMPLLPSSQQGLWTLLEGATRLRLPRLFSR